MERTMILVAGSPGAGKTTLATALSEKLKISVFYRDRITEIIWDATDLCDKAPNQFGPASAEVIFHIAEQQMKCNSCFIIESFWHYRLANGRLTDIKKKYNYNAITIRLSGNPDVLYERFYARQLLAERHEGLKGTRKKTLDEFIAAIEITGCNKIDVGGATIDIDTTYFEKVNLERIIEDIENTCSI